MRKINRMDDFVIDEISSVDRPMQEPAEALILKAKGDSELLKRLRLTSIEDGHQHTAEKGEEGRTSYDHAKGEEFGHSHPVVINDDGTPSLGMADGHTHTVIEKRLTAEDLEKSLGNSQEPASNGGGQLTGDNPMTKTADEIAAEAAVEKRIQKAEARAEKAEQLATLTDVQKAHYGTLSPDTQAKFLSADATVRDGAIEKAAGDDPVVFTTLKGREIRKSAGSLVLELAQDADENAKNLAVEKAARQNETFEKRAKEEMANLPGDPSCQAALLKAISGIPGDEDRKGALEIVKAANETVVKGFETAGTSTSGDSTGDAEGKLNELAKKRAESGSISFVKAYREVLETPEGRDLYTESKRN